MSGAIKLNFTLRAPVEPTPRKRMTPARKRHIHGLADGRCGCGCGEKVPVSGPAVDYDHRKTLWEGGADEWPNLTCWVPGHHDEKTHKEDAPRRAKTKRQQKKHDLRQPKPKSARPLKGRSTFPKGRGFPKGSRKIQSRSTFR